MSVDAVTQSLMPLATTFSSRTMIRGYRALYSDQNRDAMWASYQSLASKSAHALQIISPASLRMLWKSQVTFRPGDQRRLPNLQSLIDTMNSRGMDTSRETEVLGLETMAAPGGNRTALVEWAKGPTTVSNISALRKAPTGQSNLHELFDHISLDIPRSSVDAIASKGFDQEWLELGVRLFHAEGNWMGALPIISHLAAKYQAMDPRFAMMVIKALTTRSLDSVNHAWRVFNYIIQTPQFDLMLGDYSTAFKCFLQAGSMPYATACLCLMLNRNQGQGVEHRNIVYDELLDKLFRATANSEELHKAAIDLLDYVPQGGRADFFYAKWLKHAHEKGHQDECGAIIETMFEKGIDPKAIHIDRLISAWIHGPRTEHGEKAAVLSLEMIRKQVARDNPDQMDSAMDPVSDDNPRPLPKFLRRNMPSADTRTYALLMKYYANIGNSEAAYQILRLLLQQTKLKLNDQMVRAIISVHFILKDVKGAWDFYEYVAADPSYTPDTATYAVLWKGLHLHLSGSKAGKHAVYPSSRKLFGHMLGSIVSQRKSEKLPLTSGLSSTLYERIIRCFTLDRDTYGALLALHGMRLLFDQPPTFSTINSLLLHHAHRLHQSSGLMRKYVDKDVGKEQFEQYRKSSAKVLEGLWNRLSEDHGEKFLFSRETIQLSSSGLGTSSAGLEGLNGDGRLLLLTLFVRDWFVRSQVPSDVIRDSIRKARMDMNFGLVPEVDARVAKLEGLNS
jgi:hypothetical protein